MFYLLQVVHAFVAESEKELSLDVGDYVVVRQVALTYSTNSLFLLL